MFHGPNEKRYRVPLLVAFATALSSRDIFAAGPDAARPRWAQDRAGQIWIVSAPGLTAMVLRGAEVNGWGNRAQAGGVMEKTEDDKPVCPAGGEQAIGPAETKACLSDAQSWTATSGSRSAAAQECSLF